MSERSGAGCLLKVHAKDGVMIPARASERIMPGVVDLPQRAWYDPDENGVDRGGYAKVLTKDVTSPGGAPLQHGTGAG